MRQDSLRLFLASLDETSAGLAREQEKHRKSLAALADDIRRISGTTQRWVGEKAHDHTQTWADFPWKFFRDGIDIVALSCPGGGKGAAALLRYQAGASVPYHMHTGDEHVVVLSGTQRDGRGLYARGATILNPAGSAHSVTSPEGCVVGIYWEKPVLFLAGEPVNPRGPTRQDQ